MSGTRLHALKVAADLVDTQRAADYGDAHANFTRVSALWAATFGWQVTPEQVPLAMILLKVARLTNNPAHGDSWIDLAGYGALGYELNGGGM